jgi:sRNA-binding regulator protein Hfq
MESMLEYFENHKKKKTELKTFLSNGTMLTGAITSYDDVSITLNKCLIMISKIISISPKD